MGRRETFVRTSREKQPHLSGMKNLPCKYHVCFPLLSPNVVMGRANLGTISLIMSVYLFSVQYKCLWCTNFLFIIKYFGLITLSINWQRGKPPFLPSTLEGNHIKGVSSPLMFQSVLGTIRYQKQLPVLLLR